MQNIKFTDPDTGKETSIEISPEEFDHQQAWRIKLKDGRSALLGIDQHGIWKQFDGDELGSTLVKEIGKVIEEKEH